LFVSYEELEKFVGWLGSHKCRAIIH